ncbi:hypothetical protein QFZ32_006390 [Streptomyces canus]|nr:hypothetical protein [Streptomyces canus]MDQ1070950.1 hypothetical protein [Streptomyces canus]
MPAGRHRPPVPGSSSGGLEARFLKSARSCLRSSVNGSLGILAAVTVRKRRRSKYRAAASSSG